MYYNPLTNTEDLETLEEQQKIYNRLRSKKSYKNNKEEIRKKQQELVKCECGKTIQKHSLYKHLKSKSHM